MCADPTGSTIPSDQPMDEAAADAQFQDISATLLMLWLMMRLLVVISPVYAISRLIQRSRAALSRSGNDESGVELRAVGQNTAAADRAAAAV